MFLLLTSSPSPSSFFFGHLNNFIFRREIDRLNIAAPNTISAMFIVSHWTRSSAKRERAEGKKRTLVQTKFRLNEQKKKEHFLWQVPPMTGIKRWWLTFGMKRRSFNVLKSKTETRSRKSIIYSILVKCQNKSSEKKRKFRLVEFICVHQRRKLSCESCREKHDYVHIH